MDERPPVKSPDKSSDKSSDSSSERPFDDSSSYSSFDTEPIDTRESQEYLASSEADRRRLIKEDNAREKRLTKMCLRRKSKAGKKAYVMEQRHLSRWRDLEIFNRGRSAAFETEALGVRQCRRELLRWKESHYEGQRTLHYRAEEVGKLLRIFDRQWREAYQRIGYNVIKLKEQPLHSAEQQVRALKTGKELKGAADETVGPGNRPPNTKRLDPTQMLGAHSTRVAKPPLKRAKPQNQGSSIQKLRRGGRMLAQKAVRKNQPCWI